MVRNNRQLTRIFFILVLVMGVFGGWYATNRWQPDLAAYDTTSLTQEIDWFEMVAGLGEEAIQLFLGLTSGDP